MITRLLLLLTLSAWLLPLSSCSNSPTITASLSGFVQSGNQPLAAALLTLYSTGAGQRPELLRSARSDASGFFSFTYHVPSDPDDVLYIIAETTSDSLAFSNQGANSNAVRLANVLGTVPVAEDIVINERTTIATAYAMAQFTDGETIAGTAPGLQNAAATARNLVDVSNGEVAFVLNTFPNGASTSTRATFNALANMLAACVRSSADCFSFFDLTTPPVGAPPTNTFQAAVNVAHYPAQNVADLLTFSLQEAVYEPALTANAKLTAWTLALRYQGNGMELNGPGNVAFDKDGNVWIVNNYVFQLDPLDPDGKVCGDDHLLKFTPTGEDFPGAPYQGGGLYGVGFGITLDPDGNVWAGNFGFQGTNCLFDLEELSQTVSKFAADGTAISPNSQGNEMGDDHGGFQGAGNTIRQPQGTVSDREGNIWIANCGGNSVTQFPGGDPDAAFEIKPLDTMGDALLSKPFDIAIDLEGNAWVTSNQNHSVFAFDSDGALLHSITGTVASDAGIDHPMGIATDSGGNMWVANSGLIRPPCDGSPVPTLLEVVALTLAADFANPNASVSLIYSDGTPTVDAPFKGGGLELPWGIAVDGNDNVWVANFNGRRVSQMCGTKPQNCPPGHQTGDPISPDGGYSSNGLKRITGLQIDPSGNVWMTNNWEIIASPENPGGHEMVVFVGLAKPIKTPLIGPPQ